MLSLLYIYKSLHSETHNFRSENKFFKKNFKMYKAVVWIITLIFLLFSGSSNTAVARIAYETPQTSKVTILRNYIVFFLQGLETIRWWENTSIIEIKLKRIYFSTKINFNF